MEGVLYIEKVENSIRFALRCMRYRDDAAVEQYGCHRTDGECNGN